MSVLKCKICGGTLEITGEASVCVCQYCGTKQTLPKLSDDHRSALYERADHFRRNSDFDKAINIYEQILNEDNSDAEAYWSLVLCRYGVEYVEDPKSNNRIATVNRMQYTSVLADEDYKAAVQYADDEQKAIYEAEAKEIDIIQKGILAISQKESPFDVFICYKETDNNGRRTPDSVLANELYHQLTNEGFKVFFSRITLEDKLGTAYEPYIFAALNSAKVMVVLGTKPEYFNAVWVRNEWSRFLALIKNGANKVLIPAYRDMDPYNLPEEFSHLQAQDMSKLGFMQDLIRGIQKLTGSTKAKPVAETSRQSDGNTDPLLRRVYLFMEDGDWTSADDYCEKVLDHNPECAEAYLGKMMVELKVRRRENLQDQAEPFDNNSNYKKALRFGDERLQNELKDANRAIRQRNERAKLLAAYKAAEKLFTSARVKEDYLKAAAAFDAIADFEDSREKAQACREKHDEVHYGGLYAGAVALMNHAKSEEDFLNAGKAFEKIKDYQDSEKLARDCVEKASYARKNEIYLAAIALMTGNKVSNYKKALTQFEKIPGFKDADMKVEVCHERIGQINAAVLAAGVEKQNRAAARAAALKEKLPLIKKVALIVVPVLIVAILAAIILPTIDFSKPEKQDDVVMQSKPATSTPATSTPTSSVPVQTQPLATTVPGTQPPVTQPPVTQPPATRPAGNQLPTTRPSIPQPPVINPPAEEKVYHQEGCPFENGGNADVFALEKGGFSSCGTAGFADGTSGFSHYRYEGNIGRVYAYDGQGKIVHIVEYENDSNGHCVKETWYDSNREVTEWQEHVNDSNGRYIKSTGYDSNGNVTWMQESGYNADGIQVDWVLFDGAGNITHSQGYEYDSQGNKRFFYTILPDRTAGIHEFYGDDSVLTIPSTINGRVVSQINNMVFLWNEKLTSVTIPGSVKTIGENAFNCCTSLKTVVIEEGVTTIGMAAFADCKSLTSVTIPKSVTSLGEGAFNGCTSLTSVTIPGSVKHIGKRTFQNCSALRTLVLEEGVESIDIQAFESTINLDSVTIPASMKTIDNSAFRYGAGTPSRVYFNSEVQLEKFKDCFPDSTQLIVQ